MTKSIDTLRDDIYELLDNGAEISDEVAKDFGERMAKVLQRRLLEIKQRKENKQDNEFRLRLSGIGKADYQLYLASQGVEREPIEPWTQNKFMFGDMIEEYILTLAKIAGHSVTEEQREVEVEGVKGHIDCKIDGVLVDVKSASPYAFKKFQNGTYLDGGGFASDYAHQISAYHHAVGDSERAGFLAMDKVMGHIHFMEADVDFLPCAVQRIRDVRSMLEQDVMPPIPYPPIPDGKSGNMKLSTEGSYCPYKWHVYPELRCFLYSDGPRYLTKVVREPVLSVTEIDRYGNLVERIESDAEKDN